MTDILTRYLYGHGDDLLMEAKPVALSVNEMYSITKRLRLPFDALGVGKVVCVQSIERFSVNGCVVMVCEK